MTSIGERLESIRTERNLSLREFSERMRETGFSVSHSTVRDYETGQTVPADYILSVATAFEEDAGWILTGDSVGGEEFVLSRLGALQQEIDEVLSLLKSELPNQERQEKLRADWSRFVQDLDAEHSLRDVVVRSWSRARKLEVDPEKRKPSTRLDDEALERRRRERKGLVAYGAAHLTWLRKLYHGRTYFLALADEEGTILLAESSDPQRLAERGGLPGYNWTEEEMGANAVGTTLAEEQTTLLLGAEHYVEALQDLVCLGCPVTNVDEIAGVLSVGLPMNDAQPHVIAAGCYAACMISRDLSRDEPRSG